MMPQVEIADSTPEHVQAAGHNLRAADAREATALGLVPHKLLWRSYRTSILRRTALIDGEVAAMWGVSGVLLGRVGAPWLVTTPICERVSPLVFARIYKSEIAKMLKLFPMLEQHVDATYYGAVRMMQIVGGDVGIPEFIGPNNAIFRKFTITA